MRIPSVHTSGEREDISICVENYEKLKNEVAERDRLVAKLMKQQKSAKEASSVSIQFDYLVPSMGKK